MEKKDFLRGMNRSAPVIVTIVALFLVQASFALPDNTRKEVLYINSYHEGLDWSDPLMQAIQERLDDSGYIVNLHVEFMDSKRYSDENYKKMLSDLYRYKYAGKKFDVILCSDDDALDFILRYGDELFPGTPVIFSGINYYSETRLTGHTNITGVVEKYDIRSTLTTALTLHPGTRHVFIINDRTATGLANKKTIDTIIPEFQGTDFTYLDDYSMPELLKYCLALPDDSIILLMTFNRDRPGTDYSYTESIRSIREHSSVPIYGIWETYLGSGIVGGMLTSGHEQGNISAGMAIRVLNGEPVSAIPVFSNPKNQFMFDDRELRRFNINKNSLPAGSIVINQPASLMTIPESALWAIFVASIGMIFIITLMVIAFMRIRHAHDELNASERRYRAVVEDQTELISRILPDGTRVFVNNAYCRFFKKSRDEILGSNYILPLSAEERSRLKDHLHSLSPEHPTACLTTRIDLEGGETRWVLWNTRGIYDAQGKTTEYQSVGRDVTEIKLVEEQLRQYHENLESLIEQRTRELVNSNAKLQQEVAERTVAENMLATEKERLAVTLRSIIDGVITTDTSGHVILINSMGERITGWRQQDAENRAIFEVLPLLDLRDRTPLETPDRRVIGHPEIPDVLHQALLITPDKTERIIEESASVIRDQDSVIIGVVVVFRDITDRRKSESESMKMQNLESLGLLAGGIAHDFNNILTALFGNIILAKMHEDRESPGYQRLLEAEKSMVRAKELTRQLLTFSKGGTPVKETADISNLIIETTQFMLSGSQSRCVFSISPDLWPTDVDTGQISQVINNIVINADHAMPDGGTIQVSAENVRISTDAALPLVPGRYVKITIQDEGIGIAKENLSRIFDPYYTTKKTGNGLGLSSALSIIRKHNGYIDVESEVGKGTAFHIYLPASKRPVDHVDDTGDASLDGFGHILVMDDEEAIRDVSYNLLTTMGYRVDVAESGETAIDCYIQAMEEGDPVDIVIMDLTIPGGMGGKDTMIKLKEIDPYVRAIVSSGYSNDPIMAHYRDYGFVGVLAKPYSGKELNDAIERAMKEETG